MKARVSIVRCPGYQGPRLGSSITESLDLLGGLAGFFKPRRKIFVKINHLSPGSPPERAIVTHPSFAREVLHLLKDMEMDIAVGDDIQSRAGEGFVVSGYVEMCREMGVRLINLKSEGFREVACPDGEILKSVFISAAALDNDYILNLPKLKTHVLTAYTGAVKNLYGLIPYGLRLELHSRFPRNDIFSRALADILSCAPPQLTIMDGITAMEGQGPSGGTPRSLGLILAGADAVAVDAVSSAVIGFDPADILSTRYAGQRNLGAARLEDIEIFGETLAEARTKNFHIPFIPLGILQRKLPSSLYAFFSGQLIQVPEVIEDVCTGCGECCKICPRRAVRLERNKAVLAKKKCVHCLCCHEVCQFKAIRLRRRPLGRLVHFLGSLAGQRTRRRTSSISNEKNSKL